MKSIGSFLFLMGVGSMVLHFINMEFILLMWVENWGPQVAWGIRIALAAVGGVLWFLGNQSSAGDQDA